jgi:hypothetical protein
MERGGNGRRLLNPYSEQALFANADKARRCDFVPDGTFNPQVLGSSPSAFNSCYHSAKRAISAPILGGRRGRETLVVRNLPQKGLPYFAVVLTTHPIVCKSNKSAKNRMQDQR